VRVLGRTQIATFADGGMRMTEISLWLLVAAAVASAKAADDDDLSDAGWEAYKQRYGKDYPDPKESGLRYSTLKIKLRFDQLTYVNDKTETNRCTTLIIY
jgi:hypothetical protein